MRLGVVVFAGVAAGGLLGVWSASSLALAAAPDAAVASGAASADSPVALSVLPGDPFRSGPFLPLLPSRFGGSADSFYEQVVPGAVMLIETSGGFSTPDPQKISILGDPWGWNRWTLDGLDLADPFFSGASALRVPSGFVAEIGVRANESPSNLLGAGPSLWTPALPIAGDRLSVRVSGVIPRAGGIFPLAYSWLEAFSGRHAVDRVIPPAATERRRFVRDTRVAVEGERRAGDLDATFALDLIDGVRRFNSFARSPSAPSGVSASTFDEGFSSASAALRLRPRDGDSATYFLAEARKRDALFAELQHAPEETAEHRSFTLFAGYTSPSLSASATAKAFRIEHRELGFTRELLDPDGEALEPWYPDADGFALSGDATLSFDPYYLRTTNRVLAFSPLVERWSNPLTFGGEPYGRIDWTSRSTVELTSEERIGARRVVTAGPLRLDTNLYLSAQLAASSSLDNGLLLLDVGFASELEIEALEWLTPVVALARTPVPLTPELVRTLDPRWLEGRRFVRTGGGLRLIDTTGGAHLDIDEQITGAATYSFGLGFRANVSSVVRLELFGIGKLHQGAYRIEHEGTAASAGEIVGGAFFLDAGEKSYVLTNYRLGLRREPITAGLVAALVASAPERDWLFSLSFTGYTAVGVTPFGNGPTANDLGVVSFASADPTLGPEGLANVDGDRAFLLKLLYAVAVTPELSLSLSVRYRDGQPFSFFDVRERGGQVALVHATTRGSPWHGQRPLLGPREDFRLATDVELAYSASIVDRAVTIGLWASNLLDFGNELSEVSGEAGRTERAALELEIPRAIMAWIELEL